MWAPWHQKVRGVQAQSCCAGGRGRDSPRPSLPSLDVGARCACQVGSWVWIRMSPLSEHLPQVPPFPRTCADYCRPAPSPECGIVEAGGRAPVLPFRCWGELQALPSRRLLRFRAYASLPLRPVAHAQKAPCSPSPLLPSLPPLLARGEWTRRRPLQHSDDGHSLFCCVAIFPLRKPRCSFYPPSPLSQPSAWQLRFLQIKNDHKWYRMDGTKLRTKLYTWELHLFDTNIP